MYIFKPFKMAFMVEYGSRFLLLIFLIVCYVFMVHQIIKLTWPCRSVLSSIRAQVNVWTLSETHRHWTPISSHRVRARAPHSVTLLQYTSDAQQMHIHSHEQCWYGLPSFGIVFGLHWRYLLEKCDSTRSLSCVSPIRANSLKNTLRKRQTKKQNDPVGHVKGEQMFT